MQKYFAMFFLSAVFAFMAHAADDLAPSASVKKTGGAPGAARAPASASTPAAIDNSACPYATDNLTYAIPGTTPANLWREDGHVRLPANVSGTDVGATQQKITAKGGGLLAEQDAKPWTTAIADLVYDDNGHLKQLQLTPQHGSHDRSTTLTYSHDAAGCRLERVVVQTISLHGTKGVSFDSKLCEKLSSKHLLDAKTAQTCSDYNVQVGAAVNEFTGTLAKGEAFTIFTTSPAGGVTLKPYADRNPGAVNAALAQDCIASWRPAKGKASSDEGGVESGDAATSPTTAR